MQRKHYDIESRKNSSCPVERALYILRDAWTFMILRDLCQQPKGFNQLKKSVDGISSRMLSEKLKFLEQEQVLQRVVGNTRPVRVTYILTEKGKSLGEIVDRMRNWGNQWVAN
ncbi:MAG: helix-turn-helix transcriptional regulator [Candidatus Thermoplasmatota archaeon]|jgi:DNA-binding HxlR family transcriptional regulator|nr:helix-turn-helix transcriptional regulator [Candidatus Thermoplasmatota archaeon]MCL5681290.1 helix-turn-helix transcriptional regulator [Candidatus Thermoplasmatota archaeon]